MPSLVELLRRDENRAAGGRWGALRRRFAKDIPRAPRCFIEDDWPDYYSLMRVSRVPDVNGYCYDCNPAYQNDMDLEGLCEHPETKFRVNSLGILEGHRSFTPYARKDKVVGLWRYLKEGGTKIGVGG